MNPIKLATILFVSSALCAGCAERRNEGPWERAGSRVDEISDNIQEGKPALHRQGPAEQTGEAIDDMLTGKDR